MFHQYLLNDMLYSDLVKLKLYSDARHKQKESNNFLLTVFHVFHCQFVALPLVSSRLMLYRTFVLFRVWKIT